MGSKKLLLACILLLCIILIRPGPANALGESTIYVDPPEITVDQLGQDFNATIKVANAPEMTQYLSVSLVWDPNIIGLKTPPNGSPTDFVQGDFLGGDVFLVDIGGTPGHVEEVTEAITGVGTASGSGTLFTIQFRSIAVGNSPINIEDAAFLIGMDLADVPTRNNGTVIVIPEFPMSLLLLSLLTTTAIAFIAKTILSRKRRDIKIP